MTNQIIKQAQEDFEKAEYRRILSRLYRKFETGELKGYPLESQVEEIFFVANQYKEKVLDQAITQAVEAERKRTKEIILRIGDAERHGWVIDLLSELSQQKDE